MKKKTILAIAGAIALSLPTVHAQEADRFVGAQHVKFQTACHPEDVKHYDTKLLRERFVMEKVMSPDSILLTYSHYDRFIFGGAMPVNTTLKLENFFELGLDVDKDIKEKYFMYNRELGVVNCGTGDGVVIVPISKKVKIVFFIVLLYFLNNLTRITRFSRSCFPWQYGYGSTPPYQW